MEKPNIMKLRKISVISTVVFMIATVVNVIAFIFNDSIMTLMLAGLFAVLSVMQLHRTYKIHNLIKKGK
jgi:hypothetical protein